MLKLERWMSTLSVAAAVTLAAGAADARVSLGSIDAKLDAILAQTAGPDLSNHVTLTQSGTGVCDANSGGRAFRELFPDRTVATNEFVVPAGHTLLVTDVRWDAIKSPFGPFVQGEAVDYNLYTVEPDGSNQTAPDPFFRSAPVNAGAGGPTRVGGRDALRAGTRVGENHALCSYSRINAQISGTPDRIVIHGILVPDSQP